MFCNKCGKFIETDDVLCDDCKKVNVNVSSETSAAASGISDILPVSPAQTGTKKGFSVALKGFIISIALLVAVMVSFGFLFVVMIEITYYGYNVITTAHLVIYLIANVVIMVASVFPIVLGVKAIKAFIAAKREKEHTSPVVLVFGIIAIGLSVFVAVYALVLMIFPVLLLATHIIPTVYINGIPV